MNGSEDREKAKKIQQATGSVKEPGIAWRRKFGLGTRKSRTKRLRHGHKRLERITSVCCQLYGGGMDCKTLL